MGASKGLICILLSLLVVVFFIALTAFNYVYSTLADGKTVDMPNALLVCSPLLHCLLFESSLSAQCQFLFTWPKSLSVLR